MAVLPDVTWTLTNPLPWETATPRTTQEACTRGPQGRGAGSCRVGLVICPLNACGVCPVILALSPGSLGESLGDTIVLFPSRLCCCPFRRRTSCQARLGVLLPAARGPRPALHSPSVSSSFLVAGSSTLNTCSLSLGDEVTRWLSARLGARGSPPGPRARAPRPHARVHAEE